MRIVMGALVVALTALICACATAPPTKSFDKASNRLKAIAVQPIGLPEKPGMQTLGSTSSGFSFPGNFSSKDQEQDAAAAAQELQDVFATANYDYKKDVRESLQGAFTKSGVPTITLRGERPLKDRAKFMTQCPPVPGADACLDVYITFLGFTAADASSDYVPTVTLNAKLIRMIDNTTLFHDQIVYNAAAGTQAIVAQASGTYKFRDREAMKSNPLAVSAAVREAVKSVTATLVQQFQ